MGTVRIQTTQASPATTFYLEADHMETDTANRRWRVRFHLRAMNGPGGSTASRYLGSGVQIGFWNGNEVRRHAANPFLPGGYQNGQERWNDGPWDAWIPANSGGYWNGTSESLPLQMQLAYGNINITLQGSIPLPRIGTIPNAPIPLPTTPDQITATTMRYQFRGNGDGGSPIIRWEYQWSTDPTFVTGSSGLIRTNGLSILTGLPPATKIYIRSRGVNAFGNGRWAPTVSATTLATTTPGMTVTPSLDGTSANVVLTPPPSMPSPTKYRIEYRPIGGISTRLDVPGTIRVSGLTPGTTYEWHAAAMNGTTVGPYTAWTPVVQPNPNTSPGRFYDGNSTATADVSYTWVGTANLSMSRTIGKTVAGWGAFATGAAVSGGGGTISRVTGGRSGGFAARVEFWTPATAAGFHAGTGYAAAERFPVAVGGVYGALAHVRLITRGQSMAAMLVWLDGAGVEVGRTVGPASNVAASADVWTPLRAQGTPPPNAVYGAVRVIDVQGPGWSLWKGGDSFLIDDLITPFSDFYFDGNTPDTAEWLFDWDGPVNASASHASVNPTPPVSPLVDPDCPPVPAPPRPPEIPNSCVDDDITAWRRFWQEIPALYIPTWIDTVPILKITTSTAVRQVRVRYYPNPFDRTLEQLEHDSFCSEQIISYIPGGTVFTLDGVSQRAFAEVTGSPSSLAADSLLQGDSSLWPVLGCGIKYYVTVDVPTDTPTNALELSYSLVSRY